MKETDSYNGRTPVRELLKKGTLLFDGGMGTYFSAKEHLSGEGCELANLNQPIVIRAIHREYLDAGAQAIKTNTFAANRISYQGDEELTRRVIRAGWKIAGNAAAPYGACVFADIGPVSGLEPEAAAAEYRFVLECFLEAGAKNFLLETNSTADGLREAAAFLRERAPDAFLIVSFAVLPEGYTQDGVFGEDLIHEFWDTGNVDAVGMNCVSGVSQMRKLVDEMDLSGITLSIMPNAGYPSVLPHRTYYKSDPSFFGEELAQIAQTAAIVGGCCGTTPEYIAATRRAMRREPAEARVRTKRAGVIPQQNESVFWEKLSRGQRVIAVELDPPENADIDWYMEGAGTLRDAGADTLTIADCPIGRARMDSSMLAVKIKREIGMEAIPHMTCRDRNMNASKALLLGLSADGIRNVLLVTGDPIPTAERDEVKSVYQFNSRRMTSFVTGLGEKGLLSPFHIFGALNVNAKHFEPQLRIAEEKIANGMVALFTQPVLSETGLENLRLARERLDCYLMGGIMPIVSERNARYMDSEINGISLSPEIVERYHGKTREESEELAVEISLEMVHEMADLVDGYYLITPFSRVPLAGRIVSGIRDLPNQE